MPASSFAGLLLLLVAGSAASRPLLEHSHAVQALQHCEVPFAPQICFNGMQELHRFPDPGRSSYMIFCLHDVLSLQNQHTRQCLVAAISLQATHPKHGLFLLVAPAATIEQDYQAVMTAANIHARHEQRVEIPEAAVALAHAQGRPNWLISYQKLVVWSLVQDFDKVLLVDSDSVFLDNIDYVFALPGSAMAADCTPHHNMEARYWKSCIHNGGLLLVQPDLAIFERIMTHLVNGADPETQHWRYNGAEQDLLAEHMGFPWLPPGLQLYPDVCELLGSEAALQLFPMRRASIVHFTWVNYKGFNLDMRPNNPCWNSFGYLWNHFEKQLNATAATASA